MSITLNKKIKKRKTDLIILKDLPYDLIIPNYDNRGYDLVILKNNECNLIVPNI